jgi:hypothetical protein
MKLAVGIFGLEGDKTARNIKHRRKFTLTGYSLGILSEKEENDGEVQETRNTN